MDMAVGAHVKQFINNNENLDSLSYEVKPTKSGENKLFLTGVDSQGNKVTDVVDVPKNVAAQKSTISAPRMDEIRLATPYGQKENQEKAEKFTKDLVAMTDNFSGLKGYMKLNAKAMASMFIMDMIDAGMEAQLKDSQTMREIINISYALSQAGFGLAKDSAALQLSTAGSALALKLAGSATQLAGAGISAAKMGLATKGYYSKVKEQKAEVDRLENELNATKTAIGETSTETNLETKGKRETIDTDSDIELTKEQPVIKEPTKGAINEEHTFEDNKPVTQEEGGYAEVKDETTEIKESDSKETVNVKEEIIETKKQMEKTETEFEEDISEIKQEALEKSDGNQKNDDVKKEDDKKTEGSKKGEGENKTKTIGKQNQELKSESENEEAALDESEENIENKDKKNVTEEKTVITKTKIEKKKEQQKTDESVKEDKENVVEDEKKIEDQKEINTTELKETTNQEDVIEEGFEDSVETAVMKNKQQKIKNENEYKIVEKKLKNEEQNKEVKTDKETTVDNEQKLQKKDDTKKEEDGDKFENKEIKEEIKTKQSNQKETEGGHVEKKETEQKIEKKEIDSTDKKTEVEDNDSTGTKKRPPAVIKKELKAAKAKLTKMKNAFDVMQSVGGVTQPGVQVITSIGNAISQGLIAAADYTKAQGDANAQLIQAEKGLKDDEKGTFRQTYEALQASKREMADSVNQGFQNIESGYRAYNSLYQG